MTDFLLGLIGKGISRSRSPDFHRLAGRQCGVNVRYDSLDPDLLKSDFVSVFQRCREGGYAGINVTFPYKELVAGMVPVADPSVAAIGALNTVLFTGNCPVGHNTDFSGFIAAYESRLEKLSPGRVCLIGTGGVGRAVAFALARLGARELRLFDQSIGRAEALARALKQANSGLQTIVAPSLHAAIDGADGIVNATPVGMYAFPGTPLPQGVPAGTRWAFDAVYTPVDTLFLKSAAAAGARIISGYELYFHQAADAWKLFTGLPLDLERQRADLENEVHPA